MCEEDRSGVSGLMSLREKLNGREEDGSQDRTLPIT
jgi:hypothetical protein